MSSKKVLVVDDTRETTRMIKAALATLDPRMEVAITTSAEAALAEMKGKSFDLLVIDVRLPGISGLELTRQIREAQMETRVIQISGINDPRMRDHALEMGADLFFSKPLKMNDFLSAAERLLDSASPSRRTPSPRAGNTQIDAIPLVGVLSGLRSRTAALAAIIVNQRGEIQVQSGDLPTHESIPDIVQSAIELLGVGNRVGRLMNQASTESVYLWRGPDVDLLVAPLESTHVLCLWLLRTPTSVRLAIALDEILSVQAELQKDPSAPPLDRPVQPAQAGPGVQTPPAKPAQLPPEKGKPAAPSTIERPTTPLEPARPPAPAPDEETDPQLASLLNALGKPNLKAKDVDAFWDQLTEEPESTPAESKDVISFEQARKLGLAPKEGK